MMARGALLLVCLLASACAWQAPGTSGTPVFGDRVVRIRVDQHLLMGQLEPVPDGSRRRLERIAELFEEAGCDQIEQRWIDASSLPQVVCTLPGDSDLTIAVSADFERPLASTNVSLLPDNWVGAAMLPSLYRSLRAAPREHTYEFIAFSGNQAEGGPAASVYMVQSLPDEVRQGMVALVSLRGLGLQTAAVWGSEADPNLHVDLHSVSKSTRIPLRPIRFEVERRANARTVRPSKASRTPIRVPNVGVPNILIGVADKQVGEYLDSYRLVAAYLGYLDQTLSVRRSL